MRHIPGLLIGFRLLLSPVVIGLGWYGEGPARTIVLVLMYAGLLSDVLDGMIARRLGISTVRLRRLDSVVDVVFWLAMMAAAWLLEPALLSSAGLPILVLLALEVACYAISFLRFRKEPSTHALLSKLWALTLVAAFTTIIGAGTLGTAFIITVVVGIIAHLDVILILLLLPKWEADIPSAWHADRSRRDLPIARNKLFNG